MPSSASPICSVDAGTTVAFQDSEPAFRLITPVRYDSDLIVRMPDHYRRVDPILAFASRAPVGVYTDGMVMPKAELRRMEIHSDFGLAKRYGFRHAGLCVPDAGLRGPDRDRTFTARGRLRAGASRNPYRLLLPHFERAMRLQLRLRAADIQANSATEALDRLTVGIILARPTQLRWSWRTARPRCCWSRPTASASTLRVYAAAPSSTSALRRLIASAADRTRLADRGGALKLDRPSMRRPLLVRVAPLGAAASASWVPEPRPAAMVLVSDPDCSRDTPTDELRAPLRANPDGGGRRCGRRRRTGE